jgi:hypothetical protein
MERKKERTKWTRVITANFVSKLLNVRDWIKKSDDLWQSAILIESKAIQLFDDLKNINPNNLNNNKVITSPGFIGIYFLLTSFALENILKAKLISNNCLIYRRLLTDKAELPSDLKSHNLFSLTRKLKISIDIEEEDLLKRLTRNAIWAGRYPVPIQVKDLDLDRYSNGQEFNPSAFKRSDFEKIKQLREKILNMI